MKRSNVRQLVEAGEKNKFYWRAEWLNYIRPEVLKRDHYECQRCNHYWDSTEYPNKKPSRITKAQTVHHILSLELHPELAKDFSNLISLCYRCHNEVEGRDWFKYRVYKKKEPLNEERW